MSRTVLQAISELMKMRAHRLANNEDIEALHDRLRQLLDDFMPKGSGFDSGTEIQYTANKQGQCEKLVFETEFHHMDEHGGYDKWTKHKVHLRPTFDGYDIRITNLHRTPQGFDDYIRDTFESCLDQQVLWDNHNGIYVLTGPNAVERIIRKLTRGK